ncbi:MAG: exo-alpha-sialidase [Dokdonella sp.]|nr:exo-alpha-sialidase [Dokdonella sp.]
MTRQRIIASAILALGCALPAWCLATSAVTSGPQIDYQPAVIRSSDDGARIVVFERLDNATLYGDLWLTRSTDGGTSWSTPAAIIASSANERHPALLQLGPARYLLLYLKGGSTNSSFRIWRATSSDGIAFSEQGALDLGWSTGGEINPHAIMHADGTLTLSYQRIGGGSYLAQSTDGGASWDLLRTPIATGSQLPRVARRERDGLYLASYQVGSSALKIYVKTTHDPYDWSAPAQEFAASGNNHDSLPVVLADGAFALFWIRQNGNGFDLAVRRSPDAVNWAAPIALTNTANEDDVEPHPLVGTSPREVELYWGRAATAMDYDIVRLPAAPVLDDVVFADDFDGT